MRNAFSNAFGASGGGADATKLPLAGGTLTGLLTVAVGTNSATPAAGEGLTNSTAAISGTQSASPSTIWTGQGWKTTATAASQAVAFRAFALPVQGSAAPTGLWSLQSSINGGAYSTIFSVNSAGGFGNVLWSVDYSGNITNGGANGYIRAAGRGPNLGVTTFATSMDDTGPVVGSAGLYTWTDGLSYNGTKDLFLARALAATLQLGLDAAGVTNQHFKACNRITSNGVGANLTISGGNGRGGAGGDLILASYTTAGSGVAGTLTTRWKIDAASGDLQPGATATYNIGSSALNALGVYSVAYYVGANQVVGNQQAAVPDATGGAIVDQEARDAINGLLSAVRAHGLIVT